jgi:two-component system, NtrC family, response regulator HydG
MTIHSLKMTTVLVIDDSLDELTRLSDILDGAGYNVVLTVEPSRAVKLCTEINFDLVLCGLQLKESLDKSEPSIMTGMDIILKLTDQHPNIPIIALTGGLDDAIGHTAKKIGAAAAMPKSLSPKSFLDEVETTLNGRTKGEASNA